MLDCKAAETPMVANHGLQIVEGAEMADQDRYRRMVGKLIYLSHTRPDVAYAVGIVSKFMHRPQVEHIYYLHSCDECEIFVKVFEN